MATGKRRSSRLRGSTVQPGTPSSAIPSKLDALLEAQEHSFVTNTDPTTCADKNDASCAAAGSAAPPAELPASEQDAQTPMTTGRIRPDREEMHPAMFQSTIKKLSSAKRLGINASFIDASPSSRTRSAIVSPKHQDHGANPFTAVSFDFRSNRDPSIELSPEARQMMEGLRTHAAKYKDEIKKQQEESREADAINARKLMTPKGRANRFSDVHMKAFHKMDSIANHASSFRADPTRLTPAKSLKRSNSKANLDETDTVTPQRSTARQIPRTPKTAPPAAPPAQPAFKRVKIKSANHETIAEGNEATPPSIARVNGGLARSGSLANLQTPTKSSLARINSVKNLKEPASSSKIPALSRASSLKSMSTPSKSTASQSDDHVATPRSKMTATPTKSANAPNKPTPTMSRIPQTENSLKFRNTLASKLQGIKSILRRPQIRYSDDPAKIAAGTHVALSQTGTPTRQLDKTQTEIPQDPGSPSHRVEKHVNFTASTNFPAVPAHEPVEPKSPGTPSPTKKASYPAGMRPAAITYPALPNIAPESNPPSSPTPAYHFKRPAAPASAAPRDFTFRVGSAITFSSPLKPNTPSIRHVSSVAVPATTSRLPAGSISHGLSNKKRKHSCSDDESDKENSIVPGEGSPIKRRRVVSATPARSAFGAGKATKSPVKRMADAKSRTGFGVSSPKADRKVGSKGISMARLNALATPKKR